MLFGTFVFQYRRDGKNHQLQIEEKTSSRKIGKLLFLSFTRFIVDITSSIDLPVTGETWFDLGKASSFVMCIVFLQFQGSDWPRTDKGDRSHEDVEYLWKFIQGSLAQELTDFRDSGIVIQLSFYLPLAILLVSEILMDVCFGIAIHGPELQDTDFFSLIADPLVSEENTAFAGRLDQKGKDEKKRRKKDNQKKRKKDVKTSFEESIGLGALDDDFIPVPFVLDIGRILVIICVL